eukprot:TRINITY_DN48802_c0_g1_i1.p1 TRINITY_DN48802_c0_g1~~TRINITY_DN48802_c0_g1_i1.p1  ORF type:complete len:523 (+),score=143.41 TRINITY_DN48802_c0_g1_i1:72-1571(+)
MAVSLKQRTVLQIGAATAAVAATAVAFKWMQQRKKKVEETDESRASLATTFGPRLETLTAANSVQREPPRGDDRVLVEAEEECETVMSKPPAPLDDFEAANDGSTEADTSEDRSSTTTPVGNLSPAAAAAAASAAANEQCPILSCPWHDALAFFLTSNELGKVSYSCTSLRNEVTVEAPKSAKNDGPSRLLLVPALELKIETAEAELRRVSLEHIRILRVWQRMSFNAVASAVAERGANSLRNLNKFVCKGCPMHPADVKSLLVPVLQATSGLQLLNLEKNQISDPVVKELCNSGILGKVETLNLRFNQVSDDGAKAIAACPSAKSLRWVNLKMNRVRDSGARALAGMLADPNCAMTLLNLRRQTPGLTDRTATAMADMLRTNNNLQQLRLRRNKITDTGAVALAQCLSERLARLSKEIPPWEQVRFELDLEENKVGDAGAVACLRTATYAPKRVNLELLLCGNQVTKESFCLAVAGTGEALHVDNSRVTFESKPEFEI